MHIVVMSKCIDVRVHARPHVHQSANRLQHRCKGDARFCVSHCVAPLLAHKAPGTPLWKFSAGDMQREMRRVLRLLRVDGAEQFTLKAFRAGHATAMATAGESLAAVMAAGEWRSLAALRYVDPDAVDQSYVLRNTVLASDDEAVED